jgi:subtilisin family serine protease
MRAADFANRAIDPTGLDTSRAIVFDDLAVATVDLQPTELGRLTTADANSSSIVAIEPERVVRAFEGRTPTGTENDESVTWGLQQTGAVDSRYTGRGVRVAILDTGLDLQHPDFAGRQIVSQSFVSGQDVQDGNGHGTHVAGTACGAASPGQGPRYGVASDTSLYVGKVLSDQGRGTDSTILAGIQWALTNGCAIISMSLGAGLCDVPEPTFSRVFEAVAARAMAAGVLIIAAAGNDSARPDRVCPISHPANCPSIMGVGAVDESLEVARFSNAGLASDGGQVDIAAPGVNIYSAWPRPVLYRTINGTSMATPHVSGIAALHAEANPSVRGAALGWLVLEWARGLSGPVRDLGAGLAQAP